tara:strand:+ start:744 stop:1637 length:894 start_codon:yes stop_codon:yes gene_type:complete
MSNEQAAVQNKTEEVENDVEITLDENSSGAQNTDKELDVKPEVVEQPEEQPAKSEDELDNYSKRVQTRIKKLTDKNKEAERKAEEARREADELKERLNNLDKGYISEYGTRLDAQLDQAKKNYKEAHDSGDVDKMFEAQQALSKISIEQERHRIAKQRQESQAQETSAPQTPAAPPPPQPQNPDPKAKAWAEKNDWFGADEVMTGAAMGVHQKLMQEGFDLSSDEYYDEIDKEMQLAFPNKFAKSNGGSTRVASADTSASRNKNTGRRTVKLTASQVAIAKKLGVPLEEYAKHVKED